MTDERQYTCATWLAAAGVDLAGLVADEVRSLIAAASAYVETLTGEQVFNPVPLSSLPLEGRGGRTVWHPKLWKLLEVTGVTIVYSKADARHIDPQDPLTYPEAADVALAAALSGSLSLSSGTDFVVSRERIIERIRANFPLTVGGGVLVTGTAGWLEPAKAKVETETAAQLLSNATEIAVDSSAGFLPGDVALIGSGPYAIITSVPDGVTIRFDSVGTLPATLPVDTKVRTWGRVPRTITDLTNHLAAQALAEDRARQDGQAMLDPSRIRKESTDRYMYELFDPADTAGGWVTGSMRHDMTLRRYSRPAMAMSI